MLVLTDCILNFYSYIVILTSFLYITTYNYDLRFSPLMTYSIRRWRNSKHCRLLLLFCLSFLHSFILLVIVSRHLTKSQLFLFEFRIDRRNTISVFNWLIWYVCCFVRTAYRAIAEKITKKKTTPVADERLKPAVQFIATSAADCSSDTQYGFFLKRDCSY